MRKGLWVGILLVGAAATFMYSGASPASDAYAMSTGEPFMSASAFMQEHSYVNGRDGCRKCHLKQYRSWEATPHATAHELLEGADATNAECLACHTTGMGKPGGFVSMEATPKLAGVQCEACHGPGSDYIDKEVMKDAALAQAGGLLTPNEATCRGCHNEKSPDFTGFDYDEALKAGVHEISG